MNRTQRGAWYTFGVAVLLLIFGVIVFTSMFAPGEKTTGKGLIEILVWFILVFLMGGAALVHWKRGPSSVDFDERDNTIKKNAVLVSFVSLWVILIASSLVPCFVVGDDGAIPVCLLPIINIGVFIIIMAVYSVTILVQYGRGAKGEENE